MSPSFLICGDFNAHHTAFGSSKNDNAWNILVKAIDTIDCVFLNNGFPTRISRPDHGSSAIDQTFCSHDIALRTHWHVLDDPYSSDHYHVSISIEYP
ncbi:hypothetical protein Trydic_g15286, partial [Trypoxylus dichotomus]